MSQFTLIIELKGCLIGGKEYARLDEVMALDGFRRRVYPQMPFTPRNLITHPDNMPHATYDGFFTGNTSGLSSWIASRIKQHIEQEHFMCIVDETDFAISA
jgi:hypothetical protein